MSKKFTPTKICQNKFTEIRNLICDSCVSNREIMRRHNISKTTLQAIRRCSTYRDYVKLMRQKRQRQKFNQKRKQQYLRYLAQMPSRQRVDLVPQSNDTLNLLIVIVGVGAFTTIVGALILLERGIL